ncbi:hypothetical protein C0W54_22290 [Photobacterium kishitanii]|nr:hypothetical protein C0W54_22290 [Photobacterium kishitanii]
MVLKSSFVAMSPTGIILILSLLPLGILTNKLRKLPTPLLPCIACFSSSSFLLSKLGSDV